LIVIDCDAMHLLLHERRSGSEEEEEKLCDG